MDFLVSLYFLGILIVTATEWKVNPEKESNHENHSLFKQSNSRKDPFSRIYIFRYHNNSMIPKEATPFNLSYEKHNPDFPKTYDDFFFQSGDNSIMSRKMEIKGIKSKTVPNKKNTDNLYLRDMMSHPTWFTTTLGEIPPKIRFISGVSNILRKIQKVQDTFRQCLTQAICLSNDNKNQSPEYYSLNSYLYRSSIPLSKRLQAITQYQKHIPTGLSEELPLLPAEEGNIFKSSFLNKLGYPVFQNNSYENTFNSCYQNSQTINDLEKDFQWKKPNNYRMTIALLNVLEKILPLTKSNDLTSYSNKGHNELNELMMGTINSNLSLQICTNEPKKLMNADTYFRNCSTSNSMTETDNSVPGIPVPIVNNLDRLKSVHDSHIINSPNILMNRPVDCIPKTISPAENKTLDL